ncbi:SixA phosphatase family protein [Croceivirga radicis]|uniref:SixA phosphatase family protein n=1 Tax=Croceivirga radicis TaxID=1929488 RepID=UPI000255AB70|nr:histidine phosphatase family protein [Croceivirga radicis]
MKTVIFIRHGKSSWDLEVSDRDRPLKERGIKDSYLVGEYLYAINKDITAAYASPANRALHTAIIVLKTIGFNLQNFSVSNDLYDFSGESVLQFLKKLENKHDCVLVFGHNHAFTEMVNKLGNTYLDNLPTAGMAILNFDIENWTNITKGKTEKLIFPKELR